MTIGRPHWIAAFVVSIVMHLAVVVWLYYDRVGVAERPSGGPASIEGSLTGITGAVTDASDVTAVELIEVELAPPEPRNETPEDVTPAATAVQQTVVEQPAIPDVRSDAAPELPARPEESVKPVEPVEDAAEKSVKRPSEAKVRAKQKAEHEKTEHEKEPKNKETRKAKPKSKRSLQASRAGNNQQGAAGSSRGGRGGHQAASGAAINRYAAGVRARILSNRPGSLGRGRVVVSFGLSSSGSLRYASVARSSGSSRLDQAALAAVRRSSPFPSPPSGASSRQLQFSISFTFQ